MVTKNAPTPAMPATELRPLRTKHVAAQFKLKPVALRRVLRNMTEYADGVHTNYSWAENDPMLKKIEAAIKSSNDKRDKAKADAKAKLEAAKAAEVKAATPAKK